MPLTALRFVVFTFAFATAEEQFETECNILQTLDALQNRLTTSESRLNHQNIEISDMKESLASKEARIVQQSSAITALQDFKANAETEIENLLTFQTNLESQISQQNVEIRTITNSLTAMSSRKGSTYVRWGRTSCPGNGSELVYSGYTGGSHYDHHGGAVDYLCLPKDPDFAHFEDGVQYGGYMYGTENRMVYNRNDGMAFFPDNDQSVDLTFQNLPCAVCKTVRSTTILVPAKTSCHAGWTLEYKGYLSSGGYSNDAASQYFCLDGRPESVPGGSAEQPGKVFHFVEGRCGSLRCPPYVEGRELTCALCSI